MSDENKKETDKIIDNLATTIVDNIQSITDNCIKKAKYDKSFNTTVLGVNQNFSDKVPEDKQRELIEKFKIPDEYSSPVYYTFMINGEYYVKASKNEYYLYDEICVRVPNGSWDNMYIEINLPRDKESDCIGEWSDKGKNSAVIINTDKPNTIEGDNGFCAGCENTINGNYSNILGGLSNFVNGDYNAILGGFDNLISNSEYSTVIGGIFNSITSGSNNIVGGYRSKISDSSHSVALGYDCILSAALYSIILGYGKIIDGTGNFIAGSTLENKIENTDYSAIITGMNNIIESSGGSNAILAGFDNVISNASDCNAIIGGADNNNSGAKSVVLGGSNNKCGGAYTSILGGLNNIIVNPSNGASIIGGDGNTASYGTVIIGGSGNTGTGSNGIILNGLGCTNENCYRQVICGEFNNIIYGYQYNDLFVIGNGANDDSRSNAFRVTRDGNIYAGAAVNSTGADFAEMREWSDGNPNNEDRRGLFVVYDDSIDYKIGEYAKIRIANENDDLDNVLGIVSSNPTVVGNTASETWQGMWQRDIFGNVITEEKHFPAETKETENPETGEKETVVVIPEHTEIVPVVNPMYDGTKEYKGRKDRPEWGVVGMLGMVVTVDDGSCKMLSYCKVGQDGKATHSENKTKFRVVARLDETHIAVEIKP